jgi:hypothetical protein
LFLEQRFQKPGATAVPGSNNGRFVALQANCGVLARISPQFASKLPEFRHFRAHCKYG